MTPRLLHNTVVGVVVGALIILPFALLVMLGAHHAVKTRRGLRTGIIEGLMLGYGGKRYSRADQPQAFWANVSAGFFMAAIGVVVFLWLTLALLLLGGGADL